MGHIPTFDDLVLINKWTTYLHLMIWGWKLAAPESLPGGGVVRVMEQSSPRHGGLVKNRVCMVVSLQQLVSGESTAMLQTVS